MSTTDVGPTVLRPEFDGPDDRATTYLVVHSDAVGHGWTLLLRPGAGRRWSIRVPLHLGKHAEGREARAAATRALAEQGVAVAGWDRGDQMDPPVFRARLADAFPTTARAGTSDLAAFRRRGDALRGH